MEKYIYSEVIEELLSKHVISREDVFDFSGHILEEEYRKNFSFYQENLSEYCLDFNIAPAKFYYFNNPDINAEVSYKNNYFLINICSVTVEKLYQTFYLYNKIFDSNKSLYDFKILNKVTDVPIQYLMHQSVMHFIYYHELSHLIQFSNLDKKKLFNLSEKYSLSQSHFNVFDHILELDSDIHAANKVCHHIIHYWKKLSPHFQNQVILEKLFALALASIFFFWLCTIEGVNEPVYFNENSHPHPIIRASYISSIFIDQLYKIYPSTNQPSILLKMIEISNSLSKNYFDIDIETAYKRFIFNERSNISLYTGKLLNEANKMSYLTMNTVHKRI